MRKIIALLIALSGTHVSYADLNTGMIAHWSFDDCTAKDITQSGYDGVINGAVQCANGLNGKALNFNAVDTSVKLPPLPAVLKKGFSGCAWANYKNNNDWGSLFDFANGAYLDNIALIRNQTYNRILYFYQSDYIATGGKITNNQWQLFCVTINNTAHTARLYVDGKLVNSNTNHQIPNISRSSNFLGNNNWNEQFYGLLDDVRIWNRALSSSEIAQLYSDDTPLAGNLKGSDSFNVTCTNTVTNQSVTLAAQTNSNWDCGAAGLKIAPHESYHISIDGLKN
ncbi:MAG: LamG domain-containing protein [Methylococcaceae bacterium]